MRMSIHGAYVEIDVGTSVRGRRQTHNRAYSEVSMVSAHGRMHAHYILSYILEAVCFFKCTTFQKYFAVTASIGVEAARTLEKTFIRPLKNHIITEYQRVNAIPKIINSV